MMCKDQTNVARAGRVRQTAQMCNLCNLKVSRWELDTYCQSQEDWRREAEMTKDYVAPGKPGVVVREEGGQRVTSMAL